MLFVFRYVKESKNIKVQHNIKLWRNLLYFLKPIKFTVLFYLASSDQSEMVDWLTSKSLTRYHGYSRLKTVTKTFLEKVQHKSTTY